MPCTASNTVLHGFSVAIQSATIYLSIIDTFGNKLSNALIRVDCGFAIIEENTDENGCVSFNIPPDIRCNLSIEKECYQPYTQLFEVVEITSLNPSKNFPFILLDSTNNQISNANVSIEYLNQDNSVDHSTSPTINNSIYEGEFKFGYTNKVSIQYNNESYTINIPTFIDSKCEETAFQLIPIIKLTSN